MDRITMVKQYVNHIIDQIPSADQRGYAYLHTYGVAECCSLLAAKRGLNPELAYISGLLHDNYSYHTGNVIYHGQSGADMARVAIRNMKVFSKDEMIIILSAIYHHSVKDLIHDEYDEVLKDADVLQHFLNSAGATTYYRFAPRLSKVQEELGITASPTEYGREELELDNKTFNRQSFADMAEELAAKNISGDKDNELFRDIIKYYPEASAYDELKNSWCAAFVYYCALKAGIELPIKRPPYKYRFAGVGTWYQWGTDNNLCNYEKDSFEPSRGDIVIYNNIIPPENKQKDSPWHDHIGIVLGCNSDYILVAEGNVDNRNISGVLKRKRDDSIGCYIRITDGFQGEDWKGDYKEYLREILA